MIQPITFDEQDRVAVIAPHPDDECLGAASVLLMAADRTDIFVLTDGSHGDASKTVEEEALLRKRQFEAFLQVDPWDYADAPDLLIKLYALNDAPEVMERIGKQGIQIKRVLSMNITRVYDFIKDNFAHSWADECLPAMLNGDCYVAVRDHEILGFVGSNVPSKNYLSPIGVIPKEREKGIADALALTVMKAMRAKGYQYAIAGRVHPYARKLTEHLAGAMPIPGSAGSYGDMI